MAKVYLRDFLMGVEFKENETPSVKVDPATRFVFVSNLMELREFGPQRVDSAYSKVIVPVFDWARMKVNEDEEIIKVLFEAGNASPLNLPSPSSIDQAYWVRNTHKGGLIVNPKLRFFVPLGLKVFRSEFAPEDSILLLGQPMNVGYYVQQGHRRGVCAHDKKGLLRVRFLNA